MAEYPDMLPEIPEQHQKHSLTMDKHIPLQFHLDMQNIQIMLQKDLN